MAQTRLSVVAPDGDYDDMSGRIRIMALRQRLLTAAVAYVRYGREGTQHDRLRQASDVSGLARVVIEVELKRC